MLVFALLGVDHSEPQLDHILTHILCLVLACQLNLDASVFQEEVVLQQQLHCVSDITETSQLIGTAQTYLNISVVQARIKGGYG